MFTRLVRGKEAFLSRGHVQGLLLVYWPSGDLGSTPRRTSVVGQPDVEKDCGHNPFCLSVSIQVETIRDAYMVVAGVPNKTTFHAHHICDMALDMLSSIDHLKDPSTGDNIQIRVGEPSFVIRPQKGEGESRKELAINFKSCQPLKSWNRVANSPVRQVSYWLS